MRIDLEWFNQKYKEGKKPTLEDKIHLFQQLDIRIPDRAKKQIREYLNEFIYQLGQKWSYSPALHSLTHGLLFCFAPIIGMDQEEYDRFLLRYKQALSKHNDEVVFSGNYDGETSIH